MRTALFLVELIAVEVISTRAVSLWIGLYHLIQKMSVYNPRAEIMSGLVYTGMLVGLLIVMKIPFPKNGGF